MCVLCGDVSTCVFLVIAKKERERENRFCSTSLSLLLAIAGTTSALRDSSEILAVGQKQNALGFFERATVVLGHHTYAGLMHFSVLLQAFFGRSWRCCKCFFSFVAVRVGPSAFRTGGSSVSG